MNVESFVQPMIGATEFELQMRAKSTMIIMSIMSMIMNVDY